MAQPLRQNHYLSLLECRLEVRHHPPVILLQLPPSSCHENGL